MNDRFKFRVWHITEKRMLYENSEILLDRKQYAYEEWWNSEEYMALNSLKNVFLKFPKVYTLMQSTGLKDKNGKLIFEGDIIQIQGDRSKAKVEYNLEKGMFLLVGKKYAPSAFMTIRKDYWEVIGNIYENADLLQDCDNV